MERRQVRIRILEVAQAVKTALVARGVAADEVEPEYKLVGGAVKRRGAPFWSPKGGFKYIDDVKHHLRRLFRCFDALDPREGSSVFEIGPGSCYFLFMCRELRGCRVAGVDWKWDDTQGFGTVKRMPYHNIQQDAFQQFREHFGMEDLIRHQVVEAYRPIDFGGSYDGIVATRAMFNQGWGQSEYRFWLRDCYQHLRPGGQLLVHFNEVSEEALEALPFLRPPDQSERVKKLNLLSRDAVGRVLGEQAEKGASHGSQPGPGPDH